MPNFCFPQQLCRKPPLSRQHLPVFGVEDREGFPSTSARSSCLRGKKLGGGIVKASLQTVRDCKALTRSKEQQKGKKLAPSCVLRAPRNLWKNPHPSLRVLAVRPAAWSLTKTPLWPTPARADSKAAPRGPRGLTPVLGEGQGVDDGLAQHREEQPAAVGTPAPRLQATEGSQRPPPAHGGG